jgi:tRNA pseudouridine13 synthase
MILKQIATDFLVDELYDIKKFEKKDEGKDYFYFILKKTEYNQLRAIDIVADAFNTSKRCVHFAGTKDKHGITTQVISVMGISSDNLQKNIDHINNEIKDIDVEFLGKFPGRINLGDNLGNKFGITVRGLDSEQIAESSSKLLKMKEFGALNYFDSQRFGFANNSHIIGKYILQNKPELAVKEILTSMPPAPTDSLRIFIERVEAEWFGIKTCDQDVIDTLIGICPDNFCDYKNILAHLKKAKNDFPGAFRTLMKKLRTLYINAYQSHIFNNTIKALMEKGVLGEYKSLELINHMTDFDKIPTDVLEIVNSILEKEGVSRDMLQLKSWPELRAKSTVFREITIMPNNLVVHQEEEDELNEGKFKVRVDFELGSGQYATNIIKQLF